MFRNEEDKRKSKKGQEEIETTLSKASPNLYPIASSLNSFLINCLRS